MVLKVKQCLQTSKPRAAIRGAKQESISRAGSVFNSILALIYRMNRAWSGLVGFSANQSCLVPGERDAGGSGAKKGKKPVNDFLIMAEIFRWHKCFSKCKSRPLLKSDLVMRFFAVKVTSSSLWLHQVFLGWGANRLDGWNSLMVYTLETCYFDPGSEVHATSSVTLCAPWSIYKDSVSTQQDDLRDGPYYLNISQFVSLLLHSFLALIYACSKINVWQ